MKNILHTHYSPPGNFDCKWKWIFRVWFPKNGNQCYWGFLWDFGFTILGHGFFFGRKATFEEALGDQDLERWHKRMRDLLEIRK